MIAARIAVMTIAMEADTIRKERMGVCRRREITSLTLSDLTTNSMGIPTTRKVEDQRSLEKTMGPMARMVRKVVASPRGS